MKIICHRGAAGLALENTIESIKKALQFPAYGIEIDVRMTKDRVLVLCHDKSLKKVSKSSAEIAHLTLDELKKIKLKNGETVPTLDEALRVIKSGFVVLDIKIDNCAEEVIEAINKFPKIEFVASGQKHTLTPKLKKLKPDLKVYLTGFIKPQETFESAKRYKADGLSLNGWSLNAITYRMAKAANLQMMAYTIDSPLVARFINRFYPDVAICTNHPERFLKPFKKWWF